MSTNFNLTQPNYSAPVLPGPYRSEPRLLEPNFLRLNALEQSGDYFSYFALDNVLNNNNYASYGQSPNQLQFPSTTSSAASSTGLSASSVPADQQLQSALEVGADYMTPEQSQALTPVAKSLGFASAKNMVNSLRNVPEEVKAKVFEGMASGPAGIETENTTALKQMLKSEAHNLLYSTFEKYGARSPQLDPPLENDPENMWEAPHLLAIYNNFKAMETSGLSAPVIKDIMEPDNGEALVFQRKKTPGRSGAEDNLLKSLSSAMKVAETDQQNTVTLFDSAFTANPEDIVQSEDVQSFLKAYEEVKDSTEPSPQVKSVQEMLNNILPADRKLSLTGVMDTPTVAILAEFEGQQFLNQAQDIFEDDQQLSLEDRKKHLSDINKLQQSIFKEGYLDADGKPNQQLTQLFSFVQDLNKETTNLTPASKARLNSLASTMETRVSAKTVNPELLERVVSNWFGIIDSGDRKDFAEQVVTHELGHFWESKNNVISNWKQISFQEFDNDHGSSGGGAVPHTHDHDETMAPTLEVSGPNDGYASKYAKLNASEDFAESFRLFNRNPDKLIQDNLLKYMVLAGSTGRYAGDNSGLISFAKKNGYSDTDISAAVATLRGHQQSISRATDNTPFTKDQEADVPSRGASAFEPNVTQFPMGGHADAFSSAPSSGVQAFSSAPLQAGPSQTSSLSPNVSTSASQQMTRSLSSDSLRTLSENAAQEAIASVQKASQGLAFDFSVANYFPGIEKELPIEPTYVGDPSKPGFILDNLTKHTDNMEKLRLFSRSSRESHRFIDKFKQEGADAFPPEVRDQIPAALREKFKSSESKAIYLVMAKLRSSPELADSLMEQNKQGVSPDFFEDNFEDLLSGLEVPGALKNYVSRPQNLIAATGNGGKSLLAAETVERNMGRVVANNQENYTKSKAVLTGAEDGGLASLFTASGYLQFSEEGFSFKERSRPIAYNALNENLRNVDFGEMKYALDSDAFRQFSEQFMNRLNSANIKMPEPESGNWKRDPAVLQEINKVLLEELRHQVPQMQNILSSMMR